MVKFGRHQKFFLDHEHPDSYVVPYNEAKTKIEEDSISEADFEALWRAYLKKAREEFDIFLQGVWRQIFARLSAQNVEDSRGAPPEKALVLFTQHAPPDEVQEILVAFKSLHATALVNAEALRKLVKKYDKNHKTQLENDNKDMMGVLSLSCKLLPEVYTANFVIGLTSLQQGTDLLRSELGLGDYAHLGSISEQQNPANDARASGSAAGFSPGEPEAEKKVDFEIISPQKPTEIAPEQNEHQFTMLKRDDRKDSHAEHNELVDRRRQELVWLKQAIERLDQLKMLPNLVAHRGFHSPKDRSDRRPIENSLQAYESAWTSGIHLCECDIALTKDERLILAHDEDFSRLALDTSCEKSQRNVRDLTFQEIMSVALSSGSRPPLLLDVLQSAHTIGGDSQLIIEIKPGNREAASALARLFAAYPYLMAHCAVVMSFDSFAMHSLHDELDALFGKHSSGENNIGNGHRRCYSMGISPVVVDAAATAAPFPQTAATRRYKHPKLLVLTVCDAPQRDVELQVSIEEEDALDKIHGWIKGRLDGVYIQFEPKMVTEAGSLALKKLARRYDVGVWGLNGRDPDDYATFRNLVQKGNVSYVNTDLPTDFFQHQSSSLQP